MQEIIVHDNEYRADTQLHRGSSLCVCKAFVEWVSALILLRNWAKDGKVLDF